MNESKKYFIQAIFDRINPVTGEKEENCERTESLFEADGEKALEVFMELFKRDEPTLIGSPKISIEEVKC